MSLPPMTNKPFRPLFIHNTGVLHDWSSDNESVRKINLNMRLEQGRVVYDEAKRNIESYGTIDYTINSDGFRTDEIVEERERIIIGCSITAGVGVHSHQMFSTRFMDSLDGGLDNTYYNLAVPGAGWETIYRVLYDYVDTIKPKEIIMMSPWSDERREVRAEDRDIIFHPTHVQDKKRNSDFNPPLEMFGKRETDVMVQRTLDALHWMCYTRNIKLFISYATRIVPNDRMARDLHHPSWKGHDEILRMLEEDYRGFASTS